MIIIIIIIVITTPTLKPTSSQIRDRDTQLYS